MWELECETVCKKELAAALGKRAEDGWELVSASPDQIGMHNPREYPADVWSYILFFKRPKQP